MRVRVRVADVLAVAPERPPGYVEAIMAAGALEGEWLTLEGERLAAVRAKYGLPAGGAERGCQGCGR